VRVLVVDDSAAIRARLAAMLRELPGVDVREAASADEALASAAAEATDVVVLDVHMPGRSGLDVLPELKALPSAPRVLVVTSHPTELHRRQALAMGAELFLDKSREFSRVLELVVRRK
jgi:DNA-binding NarL/FixJ family response regulator